MRLGQWRYPAGDFIKGWIGLILWGWIAGARAAEYVPSSIKPPAPAREFRGAWIATVSNIDWPSRGGLPSDQQEAELLAILDRAVQVRLNAVVLQVRPSCDALYPSKMEPWSEYLTGQMGRPPRPYYDPLAFAIEAAHKRGLELHAWFNPYRARHPSAKGPISAGHIIKTRPGLIRRYGPFSWLDPGEQAVENYSQSVILDVVRRYDVDGVHIDDYFYPYPEKAASGKVLEFPDAATWRRYREKGGKLDRDDWRRHNVDVFVRKLYAAIKEEKRWVKFGVSPFGIWRSGTPGSIKGLSAYDRIYADSRKWLGQGWVDYLAPQLYWPIAAPEQSYRTLLTWWGEQNARHRHLWPGIRLVQANGQVSIRETENEILLTRRDARSSGNLLWSARALVQNRGNIASALASQVYREPALVPASPWLDSTAPKAPKLSAVPQNDGGTRFAWSADGQDGVWQWVVQTRRNGSWTTRLLPLRNRAWLINDELSPDYLAVTAVDRCGNASPATVLQRSGLRRR
jgi:uncharacterized lipoprotein YddW (UPF0748 family)